MSKSPLPAWSLLPKGEDLACPSPNVRQAVLNSAHPFSGPALISPDVTSGREAPRALCSLPSLSRRSSQQQQQRQKSPLPLLAFGRKDGPISPGIQILAPRSELNPKGHSNSMPPPCLPQIPSGSGGGGGGARLNKFVRRLHDMLEAEKDSGIVEWRRGLLVLHSTDAFAKTILPKYFNTRNFKTFRRQLNYYGFVHVRSFSTTGSTTTALWVNRDLARHGSAEISSVLMLKRVEPNESAKTAEGRRVRKELAIFTVEEDIGVSPKSLQMEQIRSLALRAGAEDVLRDAPLVPHHEVKPNPHPPVPTEVHCHFNATVPSPLFPSLVQPTSRQVSPVQHLASTGMEESNQPASGGSQERSDNNSNFVHEDRQPIKQVSSEESGEEDNVSAANLLLMLSMGGAVTRDSSSPSAITPDQFLI